MMKKLLNLAGASMLALGLILTIGGCSKDKCKDITCLNGGSCIDGACNCVNGYTGDRCQTSKCEGVTCMNGGSCINGACNCVNGYTGDRCQTAPAPPVASFTIDKTSCTAPCTFNVTSTATNATSIEWSVEKVGGTAYITISNRTAPNASIEFGSNQAGTYKVKLKATNAGGSHTAEKTINVNEQTNNPPCQINNTAEITISITGSTNPYKVYINNEYKDDIQTPGSKKFTFTAGNTSFKVEQRSGYLFEPTVRQTSVFAEPCGEYTWDVEL